MKRKILVLSPFPPRRDATHGGSQAIARTIGELAQGNTVRVLCLRGDGEAGSEPGLVELCESVEEIRRPGDRMGVERGFRLIASLAAGHPFWAGNWRAEAFRRRVVETVAAWRPDVVQFEFHLMAQYRDAVEGCMAILVTHEPGAASAWERYQSGSGWQRILLRREALAWDRYERAMLPRFDALVCVTARDQAALRSVAPAANITVIPPTCAPAPLPLSSGGSGSPSPVVLFAGNFIHPPNLDAALRLARRIFPPVKASHPGARLKIVGDGPPRALRAMESPAIAVTGRVPDMTPLLEEAAVVVVPLRCGGGIRMKMIEALRAGKAVVATALAAEGLEIRPGSEFMLAETDGEFSDAISSLLNQPELRQMLGCRARQWSDSFCRQGRVAAAFESLYTSLRPDRC